MRLKRRGVAKRDRRDCFETQPSAVHAAFRVHHFDRIWIFEPAKSRGTLEIYRVVAFAVFADRRGDRLGNVSIFALSVGLGKHTESARELTGIFCRWYCQ